MNGILCIDKPADFTSFDVVAKMRGMLKTRKIGHSGTLDPMATGVLPLFLGKATKACDMLPVQDKRYTAEFRLGMVTDTQDITGDIIKTQAVNVQPVQVEEMLKAFAGKQKQIPPMYSAVRVNGQRLYDLARQGVEVEREARDIDIYSIGLLDCDTANNTYTIDVECSKGTYIRTLCHDLGQQLGCGAVLTNLRRTMACGFDISSCMTLAQAQEYVDNGTIENYILPVESVFASLEKLYLDEVQSKMFACGLKLSLEKLGITDKDKKELAIYNSDREFMAVAYTEPELDNLISKKWFGNRVYS